MTPLLAMFSFYDGMSSGFEPPPDVVSRYGPALTERERLKWFGDDRSPVLRDHERKQALKRKRIALGILDDDEEELVETIETPKPIAKPKVNNERQIRERALQKAQEKQETLRKAARAQESEDDAEEQEIVKWLFSLGD